MNDGVIIRYYNDHCACPKCGSVEIESTTLGHIYDPSRKFKDTNQCKCHDCKWTGIVDDLKPQEK